MEKQIKNKPCIKCGSLRRYPPRPGRKLGACIDCSNARAKKWEKQNIDKAKEIQKQYKNRNLDKWKDVKKRSAKKERLLKPEKVKARMLVSYAIKKGNLLHPSVLNCVDCCSKAMEYHHENYLKPLEVIPLCRQCHTNRHRKQK